MAASRHITGAFSIKKLTWDKSESILAGLSKTVPGPSYSLFIYVPDELTLSGVNSDAKVVFRKLEDNLLEIAFRGQESPIEWSLNFARAK